MAIVAVAVCVAVGLTIKRRGRRAPSLHSVRTGPSRRGRKHRRHVDALQERPRRRARRVSSASSRTRTASTKLMGVKVSTDDRGDGRSFVVTGKEGDVTKGESVVMLSGDVKLVEKRLASRRAPVARLHTTDRRRGSGARSGRFLPRKAVGLRPRHDLRQEHRYAHHFSTRRSCTWPPDARATGGRDVTAGARRLRGREQIVRFDRTW